MGISEKLIILTRHDDGKRVIVNSQFLDSVEELDDGIMRFQTTETDVEVKMSYEQVLAMFYRMDNPNVGNSQKPEKTEPQQPNPAT